MAPSVLLLLGLLSSAGSLTPRTSFPLDSADRPLVRFSPPDVHNTTTLLLSDDGSTLYVGARDAVLSLDVSQSDVINLKKKVQWSPSVSEINDCESKGKMPTVDCPNFVHVLQQINSTHLYACGSYAYSPQDAFIDAGSFFMVQQDGAKGRCPFNPFQRSTALSVDGELFAASTSDFRGVKPQISRHFSKDGRPDVNQDSVSLLEEPTFVSSALDPTDRKLYFFFSEVGKEFNFVDELQIARVAQVCKDDVGGQRTLQKRWTSFAKAALLCQAPGRLPFNVLQDVFPLPPPEGGDTSDTLFYSVFTSQWSAGPESVVCVFRLQDIRDVFSKSYRTFNMQNHQWSPTPEKHPNLGKCGLGNASDSDLAEAKRSFLTSDSVKPVGLGPVVVSSGQQYSRVVAMTTQAANGRGYTVLFLLTDSGFLHKVPLLDGGARVVEEVQVFTQPQPVKSIVLSASKGVVYVGTSEGVAAVPVARCSVYRSCSQCVLARDPLCGWSRTGRVCSRLDGSQDDIAQDLENGNVEKECPQSQSRAHLVTDVHVRLNEAVRLQCQKPSNMAALTWSAARFNQLPENLFIRSADGSLSFLATADTFGSYRCEAEEGGFKEQVASYEVKHVAAPRAMTPNAKHEDHVTNSEDESFEDIATEEPVALTIQPSGDSEDGGSRDEDDGVDRDGRDDEVTTNIKAETDFVIRESGVKNTLKADVFGLKPTSRTDAAPLASSYYNELVVVSLLLATCVCVLVLAGIHEWRRRATGLKVDPVVDPEPGSRTNQSMESVPSLSSPEDLEVKVE